MAKQVASTEQRIASKFGNNILVGANTILDSDRIIIPISPKLNMITGGGILEGSMVTFSGLPKCGKAQNLDSIIQTPDGPKKWGKCK